MYEPGAVHNTNNTYAITILRSTRENTQRNVPGSGPLHCHLLRRPRHRCSGPESSGQLGGPPFYLSRTCRSARVMHWLRPSGFNNDANRWCSTPGLLENMLVPTVVVDHPGGDMHKCICALDRPFFALFRHLTIDSTTPRLQS